MLLLNGLAKITHAKSQKSPFSKAARPSSKHILEMYQGFLDIKLNINFLTNASRAILSAKIHKHSIYTHRVRSIHATLSTYYEFLQLPSFS